MESSIAAYPEEVLRILNQIETKLSLEPFTDKGLLLTVLRHPKFRGLEPTRFQALEFIGDASLHRALAMRYYRSHSRLRGSGERPDSMSVLASNRALAFCAREMGLQEALILDQDMKEDLEKEAKVRGRYALADAFEALIGAIDLDRGTGALDVFLNRHFWPYEDVLLKTMSVPFEETQIENSLLVMVRAYARTHGFSPIRVEKVIEPNSEVTIVTIKDTTEILATATGASVKQALSNSYRKLLRKMKSVVGDESTEGAP